MPMPKFAHATCTLQILEKSVSIVSLRPSGLCMTTRKFDWTFQKVRPHNGTIGTSHSQEQTCEGAQPIGSSDETAEVGMLLTCHTPGCSMKVSVNLAI